MSRPTIASSAQSAPFTRMSGCSAAISSCGVSSSKTTVASTHRNVDLVGALDEVEAGDCKRHFALAGELRRPHLLEARVRSVTADAVRVEQSDAEFEVVDRLFRAHSHANRHGIAAVKHEARLAGKGQECD